MKKGERKKIVSKKCLNCGKEFTKAPKYTYYDINNGITLCRAHHPRKVAEEKRLAPVFSELVSVSKVQY